MSEHCYPCGYAMPSTTAAAMCARECDDSDREARDAARRASRRLARAGDGRGDD